jgi:hypothetical protein
MSKRYLPLESVGSFIDIYTLDVLPMNKDGTISFEERMSIEQVENTEWWDKLSNEDNKKILTASKRFMEKVRIIQIRANIKLKK